MSRRRRSAVFNDGSTDATQALLTEIVAQAGGRIFGDQLAAQCRQSWGGATRNPGRVRKGARACRLLGFGPSTPLAAVPDFIDVLDANPQLELVMGLASSCSAATFIGTRVATSSAVSSPLPRPWRCVSPCTTRNAVRRFFVQTRPFGTCSARRFARGGYSTSILARYIAESEKGMAESRIYELPLEAWTNVRGPR